ncbi:MAG: hypothetical protein ABIR79_04885 [Candidatus Binatia bacterium]
MIQLRLAALALLIFTTSVAHAQECALGTSPTCGGTCQAGFVCGVVGEAPNPCGCVPGDVLSQKRMAIKLNFSKPLADSVALQAFMPIPADFTVAGRMVAINIGGVVRTFVLDSKGAAKSDGGQIKLAVKSKKGVVAAQDALLSFKASKGNFANDLADEGLINVTTDPTPVEVRAAVRIDTHTFATAVPLTYKAKQGKSGKAANAK